MVVKAKFADNSFETKVDPWGKKAHDVLKHTRGKGFRHEKTKRKRGGYRGAAIDPEQISSTLFTDSDDE